MTNVWRCAAAGLALFAAATLLYLPVVHFPYIMIDDLNLVEKNPFTLGGAAWETLVRHLFSAHDGYWIPLTWLSFFLEQRLVGVNPGVFHATNVVLHACNVVLLMVLLARLTGRLWPGILAAAAFAVHPAHVESIAWIAERKDVLSTFFGLLALHGYLGWARRPRAGFPFGALALFFLSLTAKPMLVLLPTLLLLLDYWPLGRFRVRPPKALLVEKLPFVAVALVLSGVTVAAQRGNLSDLDAVGFQTRAAYALVAPLFYLGKLVWPSGLAFAYPVRVQPYPLWLVLLSPCLVAAATWWAVRARRRLPWVLTGWAWYLATLAPVSGIVQAGLTVVMDRVLYVPALGIYLTVTGGLCAWPSIRAGRGRVTIVGAGMLVVAALAVASARQIGFWKDDCALFGRTVAVAPDSITGHWNLATCLLDRGEGEQALEHALAARRLVPWKGEMAYNVGMVFDNLGRYAEAADEYRTAIALGEKGAKVQGALGVALGSLGRHEEALGHLQEARRLDPGPGEVFYNLGVSLLRLGRSAEAVGHLEQALKIAPGDHRSLFNLGVALLRTGRFAEAAGRFVEVVRIKPDLAAAHRMLGIARESLGQGAQAVESYRAALALDPGDAAAREGLARLAAPARP